MVLGLRWL